MTKVYLDTCAWGRPFDDQTDKRISKETTAFFEIAWKIDLKWIEVIGSEVLLAELGDITDEDKREKIKLLTTKASSVIIKLDDKIKRIALEIERACKIDGVDSLHIASAISGIANYFITTDDDILKKKDCIKQKFNIDVINPINFVRDFDV